MSKTVRYLTTILISAFLVTSNARAGGGHAHGPDGSHVSDTFQGGGSGNIVVLSKEAERNIGIKTTDVCWRQLAPQKTLYGRVITDPRRVALVTARFQGKVNRVYVLPGAYVRQDEKLLEVQPIQIGSSSTVLRAPIDGWVTEVLARAGEIFNPTNSLLSLSNLDTVLFEGDLFDSTDVENIRDSKHCSVHTKRHPRHHFPCQIETVDARFRGNPPVGHVHASISNPNAALKPGMTGQIHIDIGPKTNRLTIPRTSVLGEFEKRFVFRKDHGRYIRTEVQIGEVFGDEFEVLEGLSKGDRIVVQGHYQLQFARSDTDVGNGSLHDHSDDEAHIHRDEEKQSHGREQNNHEHTHRNEHGHTH